MVLQFVSMHVPKVFDKVKSLKFATCPCSAFLLSSQLQRMKLQYVCHKLVSHSVV